MESICSLIGFINVGIGASKLLDMTLFVRIIMLLTGSILVIYMLYSFSQQNKVSIFITNNENKYQNQRRSAFFDINEKKAWMFFALADKFPSLSCRKLNKLINRHYEFIGD